MRDDVAYLVYVAIPVLIASGVGGWYLPDVAESGSPEGNQFCTEQFGPKWTYNGYMATYPPSVQCEGPNGTIGVAPMPEKMQQELGIVTPNSTDS